MEATTTAGTEPKPACDTRRGGRGLIEDASGGKERMHRVVQNTCTSRRYGLVHQSAQALHVQMHMSVLLKETLSDSFFFLKKKACYN